MSVSVSIKGLSHSYRGKTTLAALDSINLNILPGQFVGIIGPSGCGKSTLLRLMAGLIMPSAGEIFIDGYTPRQFAAQKKLAWMAQKPALLPWLDAGGNIQLAARFLSSNGHKRMTVKQALERVGLAEMADEYPHRLSGGMQQRLALARILMQGAPLWLMDEPFAALDELTRENLIAELASLWAGSMPTVLWVTHNLYEAIFLADRIIVLGPRPGAVVLDTAVNLARPRLESSAGFQRLLAELRMALGRQPVKGVAI